MKEEWRLLTLKLQLCGMQEQVLQLRVAKKAEEVEAVRAREEDMAKELRRVLQSAGLLKGYPGASTSACRGSIAIWEQRATSSATLPTALGRISLADRTDCRLLL